MLHQLRTNHRFRLERASALASRRKHDCGAVARGVRREVSLRSTSTTERGAIDRASPTGAGSRARAGGVCQQACRGRGTGRGRDRGHNQRSPRPLDAIHTSRLRTPSALDSMNSRLGSTCSPMMETISSDVMAVAARERGDSVVEHRGGSCLAVGHGGRATHFRRSSALWRTDRLQRVDSTSSASAGHCLLSV